MQQQYQQQQYQQQQQNYQYQNPPPQQVQQQYNQRPSQPPAPSRPSVPLNPNKVTGNVDPNSMKYRLRNQLISGYSFLPNIKCGIIFSLCVGLLLSVLGIVVIIISSTVIEVDERYDDICGIGQSDCEVEIDVTEAMSKPVYLYLGVQNYYQNHRLYVKSYSADQLWGEDIDDDTAKSKCTEIVTNKDAGATKSWASTNSVPIYLDSDDIASPCGMIANSWIQDGFTLEDSSGNPIDISPEGIAWTVDKERKFKRSSDSKKTQYIDVTDERFINWMSFSTLYNWKKLWGVIDQDLPVGTYKFTIDNKYDVLSFSGEKHVILSNVTVLGGTSKLLAVLLVIMGCAYIVLAAVIAVFKWYKKLANEINTATLDFNWD